jgi:hypothetical protein
MPTSTPSTGDPAVDALIRDGLLTAASDKGGVMALLAVTPIEGAGDAGQAVSDLREDLDGSAAGQATGDPNR